MLALENDGKFYKSTATVKNLHAISHIFSSPNGRIKLTMYSHLHDDSSHSLFKISLPFPFGAALHQSPVHFGWDQPASIKIKDLENLLKRLNHEQIELLQVDMKRPCSFSNILNISSLSSKDFAESEEEEEIEDEEDYENSDDDENKEEDDIGQSSGDEEDDDFDVEA